MGHACSSMNFSELSAITGGELISLAQDSPITYLLTDSRKPVLHEGSIFFAIRGERNNGHDYVQSLYDAGIRQFVVENEFSLRDLPGVNALKVSSSIEALQKVAANHRQKFSIPVVGVTGSNGKTIIKEWLYQLLSPDADVIKNPGSYNSQLGVPLSVWNMKAHHQVGIFEAGISQMGEMINLQRIIKPTWGLFTNIGTAHDESFTNTSTKINEKLKLFFEVDKLVYCTDHTEIHKAVQASKINSFSWGKDSADVLVVKQKDGYRIKSEKIDFVVKFPFSDAASIENAIHCIVLMLGMGYTHQVIDQRIQGLKAVPMRLELKEGINQCQVIDDTYNNDLGGLQISLDFLNHQHQLNQKTLILSDILQSGLTDEKIASEISNLVNTSGVSRFIGIGPVLSQQKKYLTIPSTFYLSTEDFLKSTESEKFQSEIVLVKGARDFRFERIVKLLQKKVHGTVMEVDLGALVQNFNYFKSKLKPGTKVMVMVKAFAYGSGSIQIANVLQFHHVDYLGVAYADEGVVLRQNNVTTPIMVMNPSDEGFQSILTYNLEPEVFSFKILNELIYFLKGRTISVHLKLDTGMHRLGFSEEDTVDLIDLLRKNKNLRIASIFSHLAGADSQQHDDFSKKQTERFLKISKKIKEELDVNPLLHILNTAGVLRLPAFQFDMVRLGIGLYGIDPSGGSLLSPVVTLKTIISQIRNVRKGESVGYSRKGIAERDMKVATIAIGYADGYSRAFSNGIGEVHVNGQRARIIGNVCMDMSMIDVTEIDAREGDDVLIFGEELPIQEVAEKINTIPYEILTSTSERVRRIFVAESM